MKKNYKNKLVYLSRNKEKVYWFFFILFYFFLYYKTYPLILTKTQVKHHGKR